MPEFGDLVPSAEQQEAFQKLINSSDVPLELGFVARLDRGFPLVVCAGRTLRAEHAVDFAKGEAAKAGLMPTVGDWVALGVPDGHNMGVIEAVLSRRTAFARWRGGRRGEFQTLAANLDSLVVVSSLGEGEVGVGRIARSLVLANDSGISAQVVLTKADRESSDDALQSDVERVRRLVGPDVPVVVTSAAEGEGLEAVRMLVPEGKLAMILGASGAGKSTLLNALLGTNALATGAVREKDDKGRHTTVARMMVKLPGAGVVCDAPGLRSLLLVGHEKGLQLAFPEVAEAAGGCRFNDCTHGSEPGCAVRAALEAGRLDAVRVNAYRSLAAGMRESAGSLDPDVSL